MVSVLLIPPYFKSFDDHLKGPFLVYIIMLQRSAFPKELIPLIVVQQM